MRLVFANSAHVAAPERVLLRGGGWGKRVLRVRYGLLIHPKVGAVLIDTGYTAHSVKDSARSLGLRLYSAALRPKLRAQDQPEPFLARYGLTPADVSHVIVTHLHADHVSGLRLFTNAQFIASGTAWDAARTARLLDNLRHGVFPELLPPDFGDRLSRIEGAGLRLSVLGVSAFDLFGDGLVQALPLPGHAAGHFGLLCKTDMGDVLYAVDTQWLCAALPPGARPGFPARLIADTPRDVAHSCDLVHRFHAHRHGTVVLCHDDAPTAFDEDAA